MRFSYFFISVQVFLLHTVPLFSQSRLDSVQHIREVTVIASKYKEVIEPQRLAGAELRMLSSNSVADAIRYFSGVQLKDYGGVGGLKTVNIRSMGVTQVGVFYDGIQLGNAQNGQVDLGRFSLDNMEEISLHFGQKSRILQPAKDFGSSGTIYLQTRKPRFEASGKSNLGFTFKTGSFGLVNPSVLWEQKLSDRTSLSFNSEFVNAHGRYKFRYRRALPNGEIAYDTTAVRQNGDICSFRVESGLFGRISEGDWNVKAFYYDSNRGLPSAIVNNVFGSEARQWDRNFFVQGSFRKNIGESYRLQASAKYAYDYTRYLSNDIKLLPVDNHYRQQEQYVSFANMYSVFPWWELALSADFQWNFLKSNLDNFGYPNRYTEMVALASNVNAGPVTLQGSVLGTFVQEHVSARQNVATIPHNNVFSPAFFISYVPVADMGLTFRAFYKHVFRMPTFNELYYADKERAYLNPEFTNQYNLGALYEKTLSSHLLKGFKVQADVYYNLVDDKIVAYPSYGGGSFRWTTHNIDQVKIKGIDASGQMDFRFGQVDLTGKLNYTYQKALDYSDPEEEISYKGQIPYTPVHSGSALLSGYYKAWRFNYSFIYTGERYKSTANILYNHIQPWYTSDVMIGRSLSLFEVDWDLSAEVNNIFNQDYDVVPGYPMPGINFKFILKVTL